MVEKVRIAVIGSFEASTRISRMYSVGSIFVSGVEITEIDERWDRSIAVITSGL